MNEERPDPVMTGSHASRGARSTPRVATIAAAHAAHDTYSSFLPPLLPLFIERLLLSKAEAGFLAVFLQGPSLLQPLIGHIGDRRDLRALVVLTPSLTAVSMCLLGVASGYGAVVLLLLAAGISSAMLHALAPVAAGRLSGNRLGFGMGFWMVGGELGRTLGPIVLVSAVASLGLAGLPWLMVGGIAASGLLGLGLRGTAPRPAARGMSVKMDGAWRGMGRFFGPLTGLVAARAAMMAAFTTFLPVFLHSQGVKLWWAGASLSLLEAAGVLGALCGGAASDRMGRKVILIGSFVATPVLMAALVVTTGWGRVVVLPALGFFGLMATPVVMAAVLESFPENRALANGSYMALNFVARSLAVVGVGAMADAFSMRLAFLVCAGCGLLGLPCVLRLPIASRSGAV